MINPYADEARELIWTAERACEDAFRRADAIESITQQRVLDAFRAERISARHFSPTNGYGYDDIGRDALDRVFARALMAEKALARPQIINGTHAIFLAAAGVSRPGDTILSVTGAPYDTLEQAFGVRDALPGSLKSWGVRFVSLQLSNDRIDVDAAVAAMEKEESIRIVYVQRSRGYAWRNAIELSEIEALCKAVHAKRPDAIVLVDNCYGEFVCASEPTGMGADLMAGSLIKNPGGGLAPTGGYIAGNAKLVDLVADRFTVPGLGAEVGAYEGSYRPFYQGLFLAPHTVNQALRTAILFAKVFEYIGCETLPTAEEARSDIIQAVKFSDGEELARFCASIQASAPVDSFVRPEAWDMPGYEDQVIMAAGTFVQGATSELSADGPMREPYAAYLQGALTYAHGRIAAMEAVSSILTKKDAKDR